MPEENNNLDSAIAIIGMVCRFPQANNIAELWQNLKNSVESITFFSKEELLKAGIEESVLDKPNYIKAKAFLPDIDKFDASFFGYSPKEAELLDPQQRAFLELAWQALEMAGYDSEQYLGRIAVYAGMGLDTYLLTNLIPNKEIFTSSRAHQAILGNDKDFLPTRVAYKLNLTGPAITIQTACSTSLVATCLACQSLLDYHSDIALVGGVSISSSQIRGYLFEEGGLYSNDGHCRVFDSKATGTIPGEGAAIVVLKRLKEALEDNDTIYAVIKGFAINNDGSEKIGYTAPSIDGQANAIAEAQAVANTSPEEITYVECHGTGTILGDPIEIAALTKAFRSGTEKKNFCAIGSIKSNFGHTDTAAGVAGLIKTALALQNKQIPPSLHFENPNPNIDFANSPFYVNTKLLDWETLPRRAGVSSFGIGGTNAHVILEEAPEIPVNEIKRPYQLLLLSAKTESALETSSKNFVEYLTKNPNINLADAAYTLQIGRRSFPHRKIVITDSVNNAIKSLNNNQAGFTSHNIENQPPLVFMFSGQGSQYVDMAKDLYQYEPIFQQYLDKCFSILKSGLNIDLKSIIFPQESLKTSAAKELERISITLPALFSIEYALAKFWMELGIKPWALIGYSQGEYIAACLSGVFSLEDALALVSARGRLLDSLPQGAMLSVAMSEKEIADILPSNLSLAIISSNNFSIVAGEIDKIENFSNVLTSKEIEFKKVNTSRAYHSHMTEPILDEFINEVKKIRLLPPQIPYLSNVTGTWITKEQTTDPVYWAKHLRQTVRFSDGLIELFKQKDLVFLEVGPGKRLTSLVQQHINRKPQHIVLASLPPIDFTESGYSFFLNSLGKLWLSGLKIKWVKYYGEEKRQRISLPTYPFEKISYWIDPPNQNNKAINNTSDSQLLKKQNLSDWFYTPTWKQSHYLINNGDIESSLKNYLIFLNQHPICEETLKTLKSLGHNVTSVKLENRFSKISLNEYTISSIEKDYEDLFESLRLDNNFPNIITHFWLLTNDDNILSETYFDKIQELGYISLLNITKALAKENIDENLKLFIISNNIFSVTGEEKLSPAKATSLALSRVIVQENPNLFVGNIDVSENISLKILAKEIITSSLANNELITAYRGSYRWLIDYQPILLKSQKIPLKENGVYLITGGLGAYGLEITEYLAQKAKANIVLVNRSAFPVKSDWQSYIVDNPNNEITKKIKRLQAIENLGGKVFVFSADVTDFNKMQLVVKEVTQSLGAINGVLHLAGLVGGGLIEVKDLVEINKVINAKAKSAMVLAKLFLKENLDFLIFFSSINSILSRYGHSDYCAANAFLDAFAYYFNQFTPTISINWESWEKIGMVLSQQPVSDRANLWKEEINTFSSSSMTIKEGVNAFERVLTFQLPQVIVSSKNFSLLWKYYQEKLANLDKEIDQKAERKEKKSTQTYSRPTLNSEYVEAKNETEKILVEIWQESLGFDPIGIYDNFFDLGGDSVIAIQMAAKAKKKGLKISSKQLFQYQTVAELAGAINYNQPQIKQETVLGLVPLNPIQKWFLSQNYPNPNHFNQSIRLKATQEIDHNLLRKTLQILVSHHDTLRLRFSQVNGEWQQFSPEVDEHIDFLTTFDLTNLSETQQLKTFELHTNQAQKSLDLEIGKVFSALLFSFSKTNHHLLIIVHHLVIDIISWTILIEDLETIYSQLSQSLTVSLANKTTSFKSFNESLLQYLESIKEEKNYWLTLAWERFSPLPLDYLNQENNFSNLEQVTLSFSIEETNNLIKDIAKTYLLKPQDLIIAILAESFSRWTNISTITIDLEMHGREEITPEIDLSRTIGWFTSVFPIVIDFSKATTLTERLSYVKWYMNNIPANNGIGYGLLHLSSDKDLLEKLLSLPTAEINFLYLGHIRQTNAQEKIFATTQDYSGENIDQNQKRRYLFEFVVKIVENRLKITFSYSSMHYKKENINLLSTSIVKVVNELNIIAKNKNFLLTENKYKEENNTTDFIKFLDSSQQKHIEEYLGYQPREIYPLSPQQEGMLLVTLSNPSQETFIEQSVSKINTSIDTKIFLDAWQHIVNKHNMLRTFFIWQNLTQAFQIVKPSMVLSIEEKDWQDFNEQEQNLASFLKMNYQSFDLSKPPLMRLFLIKLSEKAYYLIWIYHHILIDGWSIEILLKDIFKTYKSLLKKEKLVNINSPSYRNYIYWLQEQSIEKSIYFWSNKLNGFTSPTPLGIALETPNFLETPIIYSSEAINLAETETSLLKTLLKQHRLTFNTLVQGLWALLLSHYSKKTDVVFGITVSGRPSELDGVEEIVGLFINTLPLRIKLDLEKSLDIWLKELQVDNLEILSYQHNSIGQIYQWSDFPSSLPLYESILVFENHPDSSDSFEKLESIDFQGAYTKYPLCIMVFPRKSLLFNIVYNSKQFDQENVKLILDHFLILLKSLSNNWGQTLASLLNSLSNLEIPKVKVPIKKQIKQVGYKEARTETEKVLAELLSQLLKTDQIGINDNLFELGVHSLVATQLITRITKHFSVEIALQTLFANPTIAQLALEIEQKQIITNADEDLAQLLAEIEGLSSDEAEELLRLEKKNDSN